jgi:biopolymer transport protein ExbD
VLAVDKDGDYIISGRKATLPEVEQWIAQRVADDPEVEAVISGDERVQYGKVMGLINLARVHGVKNFAAAVERKAQR